MHHYYFLITATIVFFITHSLMIRLVALGLLIELFGLKRV
jgi:hypothetical protein